MAIGEDAGTLEEVHEPYLIMQGYMKRTPQGRVALPRPIASSASNPHEARLNLICSKAVERRGPSFLAGVRLSNRPLKPSPRKSGTR